MSDIASPNPVSRERQLVTQWLSMPREHREWVLNRLMTDREVAAYDERPAFNAAIALLEWERE